MSEKNLLFILPPEIWSLIFFPLRICDIESFMISCKSFYFTLREKTEWSNRFWKRIIQFQIAFNDKPLELIDNWIKNDKLNISKEFEKNHSYFKNSSYYEFLKWLLMLQNYFFSVKSQSTIQKNTIIVIDRKMNVGFLNNAEFSIRLSDWKPEINTNSFFSYDKYRGFVYNSNRVIVDTGFLWYLTYQNRNLQSSSKGIEFVYVKSIESKDENTSIINKKFIAEHRSKVLNEKFEIVPQIILKDLPLELDSHFSPLEESNRLKELMKSIIRQTFQESRKILKLSTTQGNDLSVRLIHKNIPYDFHMDVDGNFIELPILKVELLQSYSINDHPKKFHFLKKYGETVLSPAKVDPILAKCSIYWKKIGFYILSTLITKIKSELKNRNISWFILGTNNEPIIEFMKITFSIELKLLAPLTFKQMKIKNSVFIFNGCRSNGLDREYDFMIKMKPDYVISLFDNSGLTGSSKFKNWFFKMNPNLRFSNYFDISLNFGYPCINEGPKYHPEEIFIFNDKKSDNFGIVLSLMGFQSSKPVINFPFRFFETNEREELEFETSLNRIAHKSSSKENEIVRFENNLTVTLKKTKKIIQPNHIKSKYPKIKNWNHIDKKSKIRYYNKKG